MDEKEYDEQLAKSAKFHGHVCGGIAIGTTIIQHQKKHIT